MRHVKAIAPMCLLVFCLTGCTPGGEIINKADKVPASPLVEDANDAKAGDTISLKGSWGQKIKVVALGLVDSEPSATGTRLVAVQFWIQNAGKKGYVDEPAKGAKAIDSQGHQFPAARTAQMPKAGPLLPLVVKVPYKGCVQGSLVFAVPEGSTITRVQFGADGGHGQTGEWIVDLPGKPDGPPTCPTRISGPPSG
ncbi:MAG: hypothetical protein WCB04_01715 [Mycobacteriales bacterium]